jgi:hypothetical protein
MEKALKQLSELQIKLTNGSLEYWKEFVWGTWQFWSLVIITILAFFVWWKLVDKNRLVQIILFGSLMHSLSIYLDAYGTQYILWEYKYQIFPAIPTAFNLNASIIPIVFMLIYQYSSTWKRYIIFLVSVAFVSAYPMQYFLKWINYYEDSKWWNSHWSFITLIIMGVLVKFLVDKIEQQKP